MRTITKYEADDGTTFDNQADAWEYEHLMINLSNAMGCLHPERELEGEEYIQHTEGAVRLARDQVIDVIANCLGMSGGTVEGAKEASHNHTIFGRFVDDSNNKACSAAWTRFMSMNPRNDREYSQPFYMLQDS